MHTLPMPPAEATPIGDSCFSMLVVEGRTVYFSNLEPFDSHDVSDRRAMLLRIARFAEHGVRRRDLEAAFGVNRSTVQRAVNRLRRAGEADFFVRPRGRGRSAIDAETAQEAERLLASGLSGRAVARQLGIRPSTFSLNRRAGVIGGGSSGAGTAQPEMAAEASQGSAVAEPVVAEPGADPEEPDAVEEATAVEPAPAVDRSARDARDREAPLGRAARDTSGRILASTGYLTEMRPQFPEPLLAVVGAGVLAGLPMLLKEGLLGRAREFLSLPKGYYGLTTLLLLLAFLVLARVRNPEALRHQAPGEWGAILGFDRCPEVKTLRGKLRILGRDVARVRDWQDSLAEGWLADEPEVCATLSVDGHVKVYSGNGRLPKHFVSRQKLCLPASTSYWINALGGKPVLCLNKPLDPSMTHALEEDILPALERLGVVTPDAPDLTLPDADEPALTLVFDREGWSPALFRRLAQRGVAVITWHKNFKGEDWPEAAFHTVTVPIHGPGTTRTAEVRLAEERVKLNNGPEVRQIRRLLPNGRQVPLVTTDFRMPLAQAAGALFSRWSQENFFKYMRDEFNLDALTLHGLAQQDPETLVVNPLWRAADRLVRNLRQKLGTLRNRIADLRKGTPSRDALKAAQNLQAESDALDAEYEAQKLRRKEITSHITVAELDPSQALDALPEGEKLFLDLIRMIAYRAETRMMSAVAQAQGKNQRPRRHLRALFQADADILPEPGNGILRVRILGTASNAGDNAIAGLLEELNQTRTVYPGTNLRMVYELPKKPDRSGHGGCNFVSHERGRGQEF